ncbi:MAG TPA: hypothetical protein VHA13_02315, partial [Gammaproteobacteria bacterium]|nr:hypothetical protein [Gammaproteobacteria bacterium]
SRLTPKSERLVPVIIPPYKLIEEKSIAELESFLKSNKMIKCTPYPLPGRFHVIKGILNRHGLPAKLTNVSLDLEFLTEQKSESSAVTVSPKKSKNTFTLLNLLMFCRRPYLVGFSLTLLAGILATRYGLSNNSLDIAVLPEPQPIPTGLICQHAEFIANQFPGKNSMMVSNDKLVVPLDHWPPEEITHHEQTMLTNIAYHALTSGIVREQTQSYYKNLRYSFFKNDYSDLSPHEKRAMHWIQDAFIEAEAVLKTGSYMCRTGVNFSVAKALALFALKNYEFPQLLFQILIKPNVLPESFKEPLVENNQLIYAGHVTLLMSQPDQRISEDLLKQLDAKLSYCDSNYAGGDLAIHCNKLTPSIKELLLKMNLVTCDSSAGDYGSPLSETWSKNSKHFLSLCDNPNYRCMVMIIRDEYLTPRVKQYLLKTIEEKSQLWEQVIRSTAKSQLM